MAKAGTHSVVEMVATGCRAAHEPDSEELLPLLSAARANELRVGSLRKFFTARERRLKLDFEASHLLGSFIDHLVAAFPNACFMLLVRDPRSWIDSLINDQLNLRTWDGYERWRFVYDEYLNATKRAFHREEQVLREMDLYPLANYVRFWHDETNRIVQAVPSERLLVLQTERLADSAGQIANFIRVSPQSVDAEKSHTYQAPRKHHVLDTMNPDYVDAVIRHARTAGRPTGGSSRRELGRL